MDAWLIEKLKRQEELEEQVQIPLYLPLAEVVDTEVIREPDTESSEDRGVFEIQIL